jgi:hypothetical protein
VLPTHSLLEGGADDEVDLPDGAAAQRSAGVVRIRSAGAEATASLEPGVEPLQQLGAQFGGGQAAQRRGDVDPDEVLVSIPGGVLELRDLEPLLDRPAEGDVDLRMAVLVDLAPAAW